MSETITLTPAVRAARKAIERAGGTTALAQVLLPARHTDEDRRRMIGQVNKWRYIGIPPRWCAQVARITGIKRYTLAPDVFDINDPW